MVDRCDVQTEADVPGTGYKAPTPDSHRRSGDILIGLDLLGVLEVSGIRGVFSELGGASSGEYASTTITLVTSCQHLIVEWKLGRERGEDKWAGAAEDTRH